MVIESNRYALQFFESQPNLKPHSRPKYWTPCTIPEMEAFVAVILEMESPRAEEGLVYVRDGWANWRMLLAREGGYIEELAEDCGEGLDSGL
ncbi:hypothetical protein O3M35_007581 [Rhynocoris fuscipes]|uniref:Uncharacterized protein n=1 Tax=Rhynocoris fuscipes TaxID=488301 RepID=A0AAW1DFN1_9HEMI